MGSSLEMIKARGQSANTPGFRLDSVLCKYTDSTYRVFVTVT